MMESARSIPVGYEDAEKRRSGVEIESSAAYLNDDSLVVIGEVSSWTGATIDDYREVHAVAYDSEGRPVGRGYTNWPSFGVRQSFTITLRAGHELFEIPDSVVLIATSRYDPSASPDVGSINIARFRPGTTNAGRVLEHNGIAFSVSGHPVSLVHVLQYDRAGDLDWLTEHWQSWALAERSSGLAPEHPLHALGATSLDELTGVEFERLCEWYFARQGFRIEHTPVVADGGVDLVVTKDGRVALVQCKRHARPVGEPVLRDLYGTILHREAHSGVVCSSAGFTPAARSWLGDKPILLLDGEDILRGLS